MNLDEIETEKDVFMHYWSSSGHQGRLDGLLFAGSFSLHAGIPKTLTTQYYTARSSYVDAYLHYIRGPHALMLENLKNAYLALFAQRNLLKPVIEFYKEHGGI